MDKTGALGAVILNMKKGWCDMAFSRKIIWVLAFNIILVSGVVIAGRNRGDIYFFFQEKEAVTFLSALLLAMTSLCAFILSFVHNQVATCKSRLNFWVISCAGFFYLSMDEYFMLHEGMDTPLVKIINEDPQVFNLDSLFFIILAIAGIITALKFWRSISKDRDFIFLCVLATLCLGGMIVFDMLDQNNSVIKVIEETFKILGVTLFFAAFFSTLLVRIKWAVTSLGKG